MYPSAQSLAQAAPPATRTRVRWHPYNSLPTSASASSLTSRSSIYISTPASPVVLSSFSAPSLSNDFLRSKQPQQRDISQSRDKNRYDLSLVVQAVKSLGEIWLPKDIPVVFLTSSRVIVPGTVNTLPTPITQTANATHSSTSLQPRRTQLSSLISPITHSALSSSTQCGDFLEALLMTEFVYEVLRRSQTSGTVLQVALCYLEAIRPKVSELLRQEKSGEGYKAGPELDSRITPAMEAAKLDSQTTDDSRCGSEVPTLVVHDADKVSDCNADCADASTSTFVDWPENMVPLSLIGNDALKKPNSTSPPLAPLPPLPSPLLCPRRVFLASLILASKFIQDKCYSNRAWAKLSGLLPREIGRCERALGDALEWRLWVGKKPPCPSPSSSTPLSSQAAGTPASGSAYGRAGSVDRYHSGGDLRSTASERTVLLGRDTTHVLTEPLIRRTESGLRRVSTLPAKALGNESS
ncbi:hypothetical protein PM082_018387 [Marasmius tenuissimus]|nr:hypothetical protein PM082_018387 [Marasmius tenuissimus]